MINKNTHHEVSVLLNNGVHNHTKNVENIILGNSEIGIYASLYEEKYISVIDNNISQIFTNLADAREWITDNT
jgi:hypothetical protein